MTGSDRNDIEVISALGSAVGLSGASGGRRDLRLEFTLQGMRVLSRKKQIESVSAAEVDRFCVDQATHRLRDIERKRREHPARDGVATLLGVVYAVVDPIMRMTDAVIDLTDGTPWSIMEVCTTPTVHRFALPMILPGELQSGLDLVHDRWRRFEG